MKTKFRNLVFRFSLLVFFCEAQLWAQPIPPKALTQMPKAQLEELAERRARFLSDDSVKAPLPTKDGLELILKPSNRLPDFGHEMICQLVNHNAFEVRYAVRSITQGFVFFLYDERGHKVELNPDWEWANMPYTHDVRANQLRIIEPGEKLEFTLNLAEAYGERWSQGKRLVVEWDPTSFRAASEFKTGMGIRAEAFFESPPVNTEKKDSEASEDLNAMLSMQPRLQETRNSPSKLSLAPTSLRPWSIVIILIVAALVLLRLLRKSRS